MEWVIGLLSVFVVLFVVLHLYHQWRMKRNAYIMREALRNRDFSFRLSSNGLWSGEKALMDALNDTGQELKVLINENEVESWQKLTRVLTHEIMNATTPISSIAQSLLKRDDVKGTSLEDGIRAIYDTGKGLGHFVDSYRTFTQLQKPQPVVLNAISFVNSIVPMYADVQWNVDIPQDIDIFVDEGLLRQVMINLIKNAVEAGAHRVGIVAVPEKNNKISMLVSNDGAPIPAEVAYDIFVPFYTTKLTGNGIGLSLSRQIMVKQGGDLRLLESHPSSYHVTFSVTLPTPSQE
ncbi:MAG: HAMP domain-containing histidine kinase [Bacteroidales bacterium]|nr:HAMP domain-containing histidine kinase [Bacteroidales bacterium]